MVHKTQIKWNAAETREITLTAVYIRSPYTHHGPWSWPSGSSAA